MVGSLPVANVQALASSYSGDVPLRYLRPELLSEEVLVDESLQIPTIDMRKLLVDDDEMSKLHLACKEWGFFQALAAEMGPDTRANCVAPGFVPAHFAEFLTKNAEIKKDIEDKTLLNRLGTTKDMAAATAFLASDDASYITGETLVVAGGIPSRL